MFSNKGRHNSTKLGANVVQELKINQRRILIDSLEIGIPAPEQIMTLCERQLPNGVKVGQLLNSKTLNYKKFTPHRDGLFCERIFGPVQSFICACGKKKESVQNKGKQKDKIETLFCPKCEVEYIDKNVRRHRLGYIKLFAPVTHIWYLKGRPSYLSLFLGKRKKGIISLAYCNAYLVEQTDTQTFYFNKNPAFVADTPEFFFKTKDSNLSRQKSEDKSRKLTFLSNLINPTRGIELQHLTQSHGYSSKNLVNKVYNNFNNSNTFNSKPFSNLLIPLFPETYVQNAFFDSTNSKKLIGTHFVKNQTISTKNLPFVHTNKEDSNNDFRKISTRFFSSKQEQSEEYIQKSTPLKNFSIDFNNFSRKQSIKDKNLQDRVPYTKQSYAKASATYKQSLWLTKRVYPNDVFFDKNKQVKTRFLNSSFHRFKTLLPRFLKDLLYHKKDLSNQTLFLQEKQKRQHFPQASLVIPYDVSKNLHYTKTTVTKNRVEQKQSFCRYVQKSSLSKKPNSSDKPTYMYERTKGYAFYYKKLPFFVRINHDARKTERDSTLFQRKRKAYLILGKNKIKTSKKSDQSQLLISRNYLSKTPFTDLQKTKLLSNKVYAQDKAKIRCLTKDVCKEKDKLLKTIDPLNPIFLCAKSGVTSSYIRAQTLPFLPSLICSFYLRDCLISFLQSLPCPDDIPISLYCQTTRRYPLRDVHKFLAELRSTNETNKIERLTIESIKQFTGFSNSILWQSKLIGFSNFSSVVHHFLRKSYLNSFQTFLDNEKENIIQSKLSFLSQAKTNIFTRKVTKYSKVKVVGYLGKNRIKSKNFIIAATLFRLNGVTLNNNFSSTVTPPITSLSMPFLLLGPSQNTSHTKVQTYYLNSRAFKDFFSSKYATVPDFRDNKTTLSKKAINCLLGTLAYLNENSIMTQITIISSKSLLKYVYLDLSSNLLFFKSGSNRNTVFFISKKEKGVEWMMINELQKSSHLVTKSITSLQDPTLDKTPPIVACDLLPDFKVGSCLLVKKFVMNEHQIYPTGVYFKIPTHLQNEKVTSLKTQFMRKHSLDVQKTNRVFCMSTAHTPKKPGFLYTQLLDKQTFDRRNSIFSNYYLMKNDSEKNKSFIKTKLLQKQSYAKFLRTCLNNSEISFSSSRNFTQSKKISPSYLGGETISKWHINGAKEILSYTGGGALDTLLKRFNTQLLCQFLFGEIKILRKYYKDYILNEYNKNQILADFIPQPYKERSYTKNEVIQKTKFFARTSVRTNLISRDPTICLPQTKTNTNKIANLFCRRIYRSTRRLKIIQLLMRNKRRPEWMMISVLPVLPPDLRPVLQMGENLIVASDLNTLYQRVIYRNNRHYKGRFLDFHFVSSIQRLVQDSVDRLIENGKGGSTPFSTPGGRPLKSLSDILKGKRGRFRFNLLGKRVDFSGRSVIVVSPSLKIHECGLPREIALELYKYLLIRQLFLKKHVSSIVNAKKLIKQRKPLIWNILREIIYYHPLLLNRAPTLHRLGIQAFQPKLTLGSAILLHPLVCAGFNADFDGDQMGVHLPLSPQARAEAWDLLWSRNNLLSPATGQPILLPSQDMVLGFYYMTALLPYDTSFRKVKEPRKNTAFTYMPLPQTPKMRKSFFLSNPIQTIPLSILKKNAYNSTAYKNKKRGFLGVHVFADQLQVVHAYQKKQIDIHTPIWVKWIGKSENGEKSHTPLEVRVDVFGYNTQIYSTHKYRNKMYLDKNLSVLTFYMRTTAGRILVNNLIHKH